MKKLLLAVLSIYALSMVSYAVDFGIGIKGGIGENNPKEMKQYAGFTKNSSIFSLEGLFETETNGSDWETLGVNKIGIKIGYDSYGKNKIKQSTFTASEDTFSIPITFFVKQDQGVKEFSSYFGIGMSYLKTKIKESSSFSGNWSYSDHKWFFHIIGGCEYKMTEFLSLGIELKYNIDARLKESDFTVSDRSGLQGAGVVRFYF